jgi:hypothetical protein
MTDKTRVALSPILLTAAGFISAAFTITTQLLGKKIEADSFGGEFFGLIIVAYFVLWEGSGIGWREAAFVLASTIAYFAAFLSGTAVGLVSMGAVGLVFGGDQMPLAGVTAGGYVGAFIVLAASLRLFVPEKFGSSLLVRSALWSPIGGALGILGWISGPDVAQFRFKIQQRLDLIPLAGPYHFSVTKQDHYFSLFVVWQTGMALVIALLLWYERRRTNTVLSHLGFKPAYSAVFVCGVLGVLAWQTSKLIQNEKTNSHGVSELNKLIETAPSNVNLPDIPERQLADVVIVENIGGLFPSDPRRGPGYVSLYPGDNLVRLPRIVAYSVAYTATQGARLIGDNFAAAAQIENYPTQEWAKYRANLVAAYWVNGSPLSVTKVARAGHSIFLRTDGLGTTFFWPSGNSIAIVRYPAHESNEELLNKYLEKYPSSL